MRREGSKRRDVGAGEECESSERNGEQWCVVGEWRFIDAQGGEGRTRVGPEAWQMPPNSAGKAATLRLYELRPLPSAN